MTRVVVWHVPVTVIGRTASLRLFRLRDGRRCAVGFSSAAALAELLGPEQAAVELGEPALRALTAPLGVDEFVLDPRLVAAPVVAPTADQATDQAADQAADRATHPGDPSADGAARPAAGRPTTRSGAQLQRR
ncbi:SAV_915 family protein [Kitasatospora purpeofusca]|uniref:SAV_915 family protein n=1 Tax=Kitasatospora purpeofusca TaxID=67352 RepID=UPI002A5A2E03|nr:SAV_915 family protein [Kitasatospora purpeofusca]MDY0812791.1 SAV_915 family protein [Kitasatospora purpeofusca]